MKIAHTVKIKTIAPSSLVSGEVYQRVDEVHYKAFYLKCDDDYVVQLFTGYMYPIESFCGSSFIHHPNAKLVL